ncbi:MAG: hypothetical protein ACJAWH_001782 [Maribacter sp.]|jgi:hypothetical protein
MVVFNTTDNQGIAFRFTDLTPKFVASTSPYEQSCLHRYYRT